MHHKLRVRHGLQVGRDNVYAAMMDIDPDGLKERQPALKVKKKRGTFSSSGPNWVFSLDGHDKLMGFQNSTFPLAIYGCIDTASRKLIWIKVWSSNSSPFLIGRWYFDYLYETQTLPSNGPSIKYVRQVAYYGRFHWCIPLLIINFKLNFQALFS